jgi:hypothetical protein
MREIFGQRISQKAVIHSNIDSSTKYLDKQGRSISLNARHSELFFQPVFPYGDEMQLTVIF